MFEESDGTILDTDSATIDEIIECFWHKLLVLVLFSAKYPLPPDTRFKGVDVCKLQQQPHESFNTFANRFMEAYHGDATGGSTPRIAIVWKDLSTTATGIAATNVPLTLQEFLALELSAGGGHTERAINQYELLVLLFWLWNYGDTAKGRTIVYLGDNTTALSAIIHGYATKQSLAAIANCISILLAISLCGANGSRRRLM
ncbi:hypothetical protein RI054_28g115100 [Pseudoscourfieldia marina]